MPDWFLAVLSLLGGSALGLLGWLAQLRSSDRSRVAELEKRLDLKERQERVDDDYILELRNTLEAAGLKVPPYPVKPSE